MTLPHVKPLPPVPNTRHLIMISFFRSQHETASLAWNRLDRMAFTFVRAVLLTLSHLYWETRPAHVLGVRRKRIPNPARLAFHHSSAPELDPSPSAGDWTDETNRHPALTAEHHTYCDNLGSVPARPGRRQRPSNSRPTTTSSTIAAMHSLLKTIAKLHALEKLIPSTRFGKPRR